jgi:hypothetical protein
MAYSADVILVNHLQADSHSASLQILYLLWCPKIYYYVSQKPFAAPYPEAGESGPQSPF